MDVSRVPLCGRNFEYTGGEDPCIIYLHISAYIFISSAYN